MGIQVLGISHHRAPVELRERLAFDSARLAEALRASGPYARECLILSTCNRTEVYAVTGHRRSGRESLIRFLADRSGVPMETFAPVAYDAWQEEAVRHLFRVSAGLDSLVIGEPQILGQVRSAFGAASLAGTVGPLLSRLLRQALEVGKAARTRVAISRKAVSVSFAAVELAREVLGTLDGRAVLIVGAGETAELAVSTLMKHGPAELLVANRTAERAAALAARAGGVAVSFDRLGDSLAAADIVLTCTASPEPIVSCEMLARAVARRPERPLLVVDVAVPRDVEADAADLPGVHLFNVDDLHGIIRRNLAARKREAIAAERLIEAEVPRFMAWWDAQDVAPTIRALTQRAEAIRQEELARASGRLGGLSERDREVVNALTRAIVGKLLHEPVVRLKERAAAEGAAGYVRAVHELFALDAPALEEAAS